ncbi:MAG: phosphate ABC transporter permease subunit PstC [Candidatus Nanopelagicales bacterium]|nr:phosphate ABC transporter permease subunit PstC [Candidatus Nanopelagicales bacterium]MCF8539504.1 phosphate ABC transporter permease subunit PstC [Candidatus Nanopelagicales bacterium]MCF8550545.1 phosphate ABC transporter permease subunit PstC [Candidatus Nanopelagicales bacterium]
MSTQISPSTAAANPLRQSKHHYGERIVRGSLLVAAIVSVLTTFGIVLSLLIPSIEFFAEIPLGDFLFGTVWTPLFANGEFGVLPLVSGTLVITGIAVIVAIPLGLGSAIYLSEYASPRVRKVLKPTLEVLAGIPTVVFGFFALEFLTQLILVKIFPGIEVFNALSAGIIMGIMIIPTIASLSEDAMAAVPGGLRDGAYALGSTRRQTAMKVVIPAALSGIVAAFVLGISRAIGETMIVTVAAGLQPQLSLNPLIGMQTMTSYIAAAGSGDLATGSIEYKSIFAVGLLLFVLTFIMNIFSVRLVRRFRQVYQ